MSQVVHARTRVNGFHQNLLQLQLGMLQSEQGIVANSSSPETCLSMRIPNTEHLTIVVG